MQSSACLQLKIKTIIANDTAKTKISFITVTLHTKIPLCENKLENKFFFTVYILLLFLL